MRIRPGSISRTKLTTAGFISRPHQAGSRNPPNNLVEPTSPGHLPPSALSGHVETTSPDHPHTPELAKARDKELSRQPRAHQGRTQTDPQEGAISLLQSGYHTVSHLPQTPPCAARPDSVIEVGLEPPVAASTSCIPREDLPPVMLEIPGGSPEPEEELYESHQCPDTPGNWFQPPTRSPKRSRSDSPPSPRRPRKHFSSLGRWCE